MSEMNIETVEKMIYEIRGQRVMLDSDLAELYGVETKRLNEQVKRNAERFPEDFMFKLDPKELEFLRSQFATSNEGTLRSQFVTSRSLHGGRRYQPFVFTESGVAMLSSVLNSPRAIQVNISIMRTFIKLRSFLSMEQSRSNEVNQLGEATFRMFRIVFERLNGIEDRMNRPALDPTRKKIGIKKGP